MPIPDSWLSVLEGETTKPYYQQLYRFVGEERRKYKVYPLGEDVFNALRYTPFERVRVVIIGQDPYHEENQAHGLAFSVRPGVPAPPSLVTGNTTKMRDGQLFHIITYGRLNMPSQAGLLAPEDRWAVILHIRSLQTPIASQSTGAKP